LHSAKGNRSKAAQELGMSRATFYRKLQHYGFVAKTNTEMISIDDSISEE
jgi:DNA-binding NtrC family response regulator